AEENRGPLGPTRHRGSAAAGTGHQGAAMRPGEIIPAEEPVPLNPGRKRVRITVVNRADRAVQVGSHYHFAAVHPALDFDRAAAWGHRLDVPAGTEVPFEP